MTAALWVPPHDISLTNMKLKIFSSLFSFLPPSTTLRRYIRTTHATTIAELGELYCDIISYTEAHRYSGGGGLFGGLNNNNGSNNNSVVNPEELAKNLVATRSKLKRLSSLRVNVVYEVSGSCF